VTGTPRGPLTSASVAADGSRLSITVVCASLRWLTTATGRDRVVPWTVCRSTP
jgi:hypothetical protein